MDVVTAAADVENPVVDVVTAAVVENPVVDLVTAAVVAVVARVRQTAEEDGRQLQVKQIWRLRMVLLAGRQVRVAFISYSSLPAEEGKKCEDLDKHKHPN